MPWLHLAFKLKSDLAQGICAGGMPLCGAMSHQRRQVCICSLFSAALLQVQQQWHNMTSQIDTSAAKSSALYNSPAISRSLYVHAWNGPGMLVPEKHCFALAYMPILTILVSASAGLNIGPLARALTMSATTACQHWQVRGLRMVHRARQVMVTALACDTDMQQLLMETLMLLRIRWMTC